MLLSEIEERERRFKLALRAGIPLILLISLVFYSTFIRDKHFTFDIETSVLLGSLVFITVYFIYFLMELSVKESLLDQTTHGFNERAFAKKLKKYHPKTLVLLMIRNLSTINENYSVDEVDNLLYTIIHNLNDTFKVQGLSNALIARRAGAEFIVAFDRNRDDIETIFHEFIRRNAKLHDIEIDYAFAAITNIGDEIEKDILHLKNLITIRDKEHTAKKADLVIDAKSLSEVENAVLDALEKRRLSLLFRPLLNTRSKDTDIYEISARLTSPSQGEILPRVYLPIVNRLGKGKVYDRILYEHVLELLPLIDDHISLSFNLSPFSLREEGFQKDFFKALAQSGVSPERLIIELYERKTHHDLSGYLKTLERFRTKGVRIAIDNFGSSNASMEYMKHFHFDLVQFDRDYVTKLGDVNTRAMLNSLIQMAKELEIVTVAKWVDKPEQKEQLVAMGIDYLQGFGIAKAIDERELITRYNQL